MLTSYLDQKIKDNEKQKFLFCFSIIILKWDVIHGHVPMILLRLSALNLCLNKTDISQVAM